MNERLSDEPGEDDGRHWAEAELERLHPDSFGWALCCCGHDRTEAEEVLQTAYLKVLDGRARYDGRAAFRTWFFGVIRRTALDWRRRAWRRCRRLLSLAETEEPISPGVEPEADARLAEAACELPRALAALSPRQREVLHLVFYQDLSLSEAAAAMGVTVGSARQHYGRAKARLKAWLEAIQPTDEHGKRRPRVA